MAMKNRNAFYIFSVLSNEAIKPSKLKRHQQQKHFVATLIFHEIHQKVYLSVNKTKIALKEKSTVNGCITRLKGKE